MKVMRTLTPLALVAALAAPVWAGGYEFEAPVQITPGGESVKVESPGYAAPCLADVDGDGIDDLLVGQFKDGKIGFYKGLKKGSMEFAAHQWLQAGGDVAKVPGVW